MITLRVFTFASDWGFAPAGPFAVKLLAWLELAKIPYQQVLEDNPRKGSKGKNPWIELDGERMATASSSSSSYPNGMASTWMPN